MAKEGDRLLSTKEVKEILNVDYMTIYSFITEGKLKAHKLGGNGSSRRHYRIWLSDLMAFINGEESND